MSFGSQSVAERQCSVLACRRACCHYLNRLLRTDYADTSHPEQTHTRYAPLHQKSSTMGDTNPVTEQVTQFNKGQLKKTNTKERNCLPTQDDIAQEKKEQQCKGSS